MAAERMQTSVSRPAGYTCFCRACAEAERDERFRGPDNIAREFVPFLPTVLFLKCRPLRRLMLKRFSRGIYEYVSARTGLFDEVFCRAVKGAVPQIVLLGAGFDTRAWRFASLDRGTRIFEMDAPVTQEMKKELLARRGIPRPGNLAVIRTIAAAGSLVLFDYVQASVLRKERNLYGEESIVKRVSRSGEKWRFGIEKDRINDFLEARGFDLVKHYSPAELREKYLTADDGTVYGRINETHCIALAAVADREPRP